MEETPEQRLPSAVPSAPLSTREQDDAFKALIEATGGGPPATASQRAKTILGADFWLGCIAGTAVTLAAVYSQHVLDEAVVVLSTQILVGGGLLAVVLAALAILTAFFDEKYREALRAGTGGFAGVVFPFKVVAFAGASSAATGIATITLWGLLPHTLKAVAFGVVSGATVWAIVGTWQLVSDTTFHGVKRAELLELERIEELFREQK
jgi:hypothetical protein